ncbi:sensor histidine kinase [Micromonospora echinofusca]|uniref:Oxygen sensor histidine kinase NreB n=1 Tax=Micromonospora echinofusca TaxID=47858 RepID=A0ABS3VZ71_MICEH|nr:sensor histidine kinase [Micromonospora echinofusca]
MPAAAPRAGSPTGRAPYSPARLLPVLLHGLVLVLLTVTAVRALTGSDPASAHPVVVPFAVAVFAVVYAVGAGTGRPQRSPAAAGRWLLAVGLAWLLLLASTPDGVWLAFPLFFLQMHLLPARWGLAAVAGTTVAAVVGYSWHAHRFTPAALIGPTLGAAVAVAVVLGYQALHRESEQRRRLIEQLEATRSDLAAAEHARGVLAERERLAREIHDTLAQGLSSIQLLLGAAARHLPERPEAAAGYVDQARGSAQENLAEARRFVRALVPPGLAGGSLPAALHRLCATTSRQAGLPTRLHVDGNPVPLPTPYEVALLRIAQSALANTVRHARAGRADLTVTYMPDRVALDVVDDGVGFDPGATTGHGDGGFGLTAMRTRAAELGGTLTVESAPGQGTALAVSFPFSAERYAADNRDGVRDHD